MSYTTYRRALRASAGPWLPRDHHALGDELLRLWAVRDDKRVPPAALHVRCLEHREVLAAPCNVQRPVRLIHDDSEERDPGVSLPLHHERVVDGAPYVDLLASTLVLEGRLITILRVVDHDLEVLDLARALPGAADPGGREAQGEA